MGNFSFNSISGEDNCMLVGAFSEEKVKLVVWSCDSLKSLGPYGFLNEDILSVVNEFANSGRWPRGSNTSFICLVPKVDNLHQLGDFRLISLVGCLYKIVSNILSLRLKKVISKVIINLRQTAFLKEEGCWTVFLWLTRS